MTKNQLYDYLQKDGWEYISWRSSHGVSIYRKNHTTIALWYSSRYGIEILINGRTIKGIELLSEQDIAIYGEP